MNTSIILETFYNPGQVGQIPECQEKFHQQVLDRFYLSSNEADPETVCQDPKPAGILT